MYLETLVNPNIILFFTLLDLHSQKCPTKLFSLIWKSQLLYTPECLDREECAFLFWRGEGNAYYVFWHRHLYIYFQFCCNLSIRTGQTEEGYWSNFFTHAKWLCSFIFALWFSAVTLWPLVNWTWKMSPGHINNCYCFQVTFSKITKG